MSHAVIGMFETVAAANTAKQKLMAAGLAASDIKVSTTPPATGTTTSTDTATEDKGFWSSVKEMFTGEDEAEGVRHVNTYSENVRRGGAVVSVEATEANAHKVADILDAAGAVDVDEKAESFRSSGWTGYVAPTTARTTAATTANAATATTAAKGTAAAAGSIDLVKEELAVGKRVVNRGGVRIVKKIISRPVEQSVSLREEHVNVDRRVVDRPLSGNALNDAFKDSTIEMTESAEEAVASKTAHVVGEVVIGKTATERTETVRDTLRETDVKVEQLPGQATTSSTKVVEGTPTTSKTTKTNV